MDTVRAILLFYSATTSMKSVCFGRSLEFHRSARMRRTRKYNVHNENTEKRKRQDFLKWLEKISWHNWRLKPCVFPHKNSLLVFRGCKNMNGGKGWGYGPQKCRRLFSFCVTLNSKSDQKRWKIRDCGSRYRGTAQSKRTTNTLVAANYWFSVLFN